MKKQPSDQKYRNLTAEGCIIFREKADYRSASFTYSCRSATLLYAGRMILPLFASSSMRWALQPTIRAMAKIGV